MARVKTAKWLSFVSGVIMILLGVVYLLNPKAGALTLVRLIGILILVMGILRIVRYFTSEYFRFGGVLVSGIVDTLVGVLILFNVPVAALSFSLLLALWVLVGGLFSIAKSLDLKRIQIPFWWIQLLSGVISTVFGVMLLGNTTLSAFYVSLLVAIHMFVTGGNFIALFFAFRRIERHQNF